MAHCQAAKLQILIVYVFCVKLTLGLGVHDLCVTKLVAMKPVCGVLVTATFNSPDLCFFPDLH